MKKVITILALISMLFSVQTTTALAAGTDRTTCMLVSEMTTVDYDYTSDVYCVSVFSIYSMPTEKASGYQYKSATHSKYFYIISTGEKVAEYSLTANFRYDKDVEKAECRSTSTTGKSLVSGWTISRLSCVDNVSSALGAGRDDYSLYKDGTLNNTDTIYIYCDHNGKITKS